MNDNRCLTSPLPPAYQGLSLYFPSAITKQGSQHAIKVRGASPKQYNDSLILTAYEKLAAQQESLEPIVGMYRAIHSAVTGKSSQPAGSKRSGSSHAGRGGSQNDAESIAGFGIKDSYIYQRGRDFAYYVNPEKGVSPDQVLQMMGFVHPFNASTMLVAQVRTG